MNGIIQEVACLRGMITSGSARRFWRAARRKNGYGRWPVQTHTEPTGLAATVTPSPSIRRIGPLVFPLWHPDRVEDNRGHPAPVGAKRSITPGPGPAEVWGKETAGQALRMKIRNPMVLTWIDRSKAPRGREATSDALAGRAARQNAQRNERIRSWRGDGVIRGLIRPDEDLRSAVMAQIKVARPLSPPAPDVPELNRRMHS